jgi:STE24 endopeptidase
METLDLKAKRYSFAKRLIAIGASIINLAYFSVILLSGASLKIAYFAQGISANAYISLIIYLIIVGVILELLLLPLEYSGGFRLDCKFGLSRQGLFSWAIDYIKRLLLSSVIFAAMISMFYFLIINSPTFWWIWAGIIFFMVSIVLAKVFPMIIIPMFYRLTRISDTQLKEKLSRLAEQAGVKIIDIYKIALGAKTSRANAAVCGLGNSKRILLSDTLLERYTQDEIEVTLAHEIAHHKHNHFWKLSAMGILSMFLFLYLTDIMLARITGYGFIPSKQHMSAFPAVMILYILFNLTVLPVNNFISRRYETQADKDAVNLTGKAYALSGLMRKLSRQNLSDPSPSMLVKILFYDHPPAQERIAFAESMDKKT